jgi:hypothetical protein
LPKLLKVMRLRCAVPKTPVKSSVPLGSPLNKLRSLLTRSESTLPQTLVPLDFISFNSNVYRKSGEGHSVPAQKFVNSSLAVRRSCVHARTPTTPFRSYIYFITRGHPPGVGVPQWWDSQSWLSFLGLSPVTERGPRTTAPIGPPVPLRRNPQSARITQVAQDAAARKHIRPGWCLKYRERTSGRQCQNAVPVASRSQRATRGSHSQEGLGPTF